ncbi:wu:fc21g02 isoform X2 [Hoplias malabaricus]|uniref:wu:fc21g02 isoform X1 n=1 Tax=Hoplias malabaricus TaxID=27720 RepID=UPI003462E1EF
MWGCWILLCAAFFTGSCDTKVDYVTLMHGHQLSISLSATVTDTLEYATPDESKHYVLCSKTGICQRGRLTGVSDRKRFTITSVNFDDEGTYIQKNFWNVVTHVTKVKVAAKKTTKDCIPGETLSISMDGLKKEDVNLFFSNYNERIQLVQRGTPLRGVSDFSDRIKVTSSYIEVLKVNVSDVGNYTLYDGQNRKVVTVLLNLVDHHEGVSGGPLMALLLLLGIPAGICCCCRKRIFKKSYQSTTTTVMQSENVVAPPGPPPTYNSNMTPMGPGQMYTPGYPAPGGSTVPPPPANVAYPQQPSYNVQPAMPHNPNPAYPPAAVYPPAQPQQWPGAPYNTPAPAAFPPMMYSAPPGSEMEKNQGDIMLNQGLSTTPLIGPEVGQPPATDVLNSSDSAIQFNIGTGKGPAQNFL